MGYFLLADLVVLAHALFVIFVVGGGALVVRWPGLAKLHLPAAVWGIAIELGGWTCPLTYVENYFRRLGGKSGYREDFIQHHLVPLLYPAGLSQKSQLMLGSAALAINGIVYAYLWRHHRKIGQSPKQ